LILAEDYENSPAIGLRKNKANFGKALKVRLTEHDLKKQSQFAGGQVHVTFFRKKHYEKNLVGGFQKTNAIQSQFRNNPKACPGFVDEAPICPGHLFINRMSRIRCVCGLEVLCAPGAQASTLPREPDDGRSQAEAGRICQNGTRIDIGKFENSRAKKSLTSCNKAG
jgi:hypothetical protein